MTKADRIRQLDAEDIFTTREIAEIVGCRSEYVRVCARQRAGGKIGTIDKKYEKRKSQELGCHRRTQAYRTDEDYRRRHNQQCNEYQRNRYANDPEFRERRKARQRQRYATKKLEAAHA